MQASEITVGMRVMFDGNYPRVICQVITQPRPHEGQMCVLLRGYKNYVPIDELKKWEGTND